MQKKKWLNVLENNFSWRYVYVDAETNSSTEFQPKILDETTKRQQLFFKFENDFNACWTICRWFCYFPLFYSHWSVMNFAQERFTKCQTWRRVSVVRKLFSVSIILCVSSIVDSMWIIYLIFFNLPTHVFIFFFFSVFF